MIQALTPVHATLMAGMHHVCFKDPWNEAAMAELLAMPGAFGWLAEEGGPQGFILARTAADESEILTLLILPPFRRQGLARTLIEKAATGARDSGAAHLFIEVAASNIAALALYTNSRFQQVGCRRHYYGAGLDALLMSKSL